MAKLSAISIASIYTVAQINTKILEYQEMLDRAVQGAARLDTTAGAQSTTPPDPIEVGQLLEVYLKALRIKQGDSGARLLNADYRPNGAT